MTVASPCIRNCCLDDDDICLGCYRSLDEILLWAGASDDEKMEMLLNAENRKIERKKKYDL